MKVPVLGPRGIRRLALCTGLGVLVLMMSGATVTSLDAGMAYETWPHSDGSVLIPHNFFANKENFSEHFHRLLGAGVGLCSIALVVFLWRGEKRRWLVKLGLVTLGAVCLQGLLGGQRVLRKSVDLALVHGCFAQIVLCLFVAVVYFLSRDGREEPRTGRAPLGLSATALAALFMVFLQIAFGARVRHHGGGLVTHASPFFEHIAGAVVATVTVGAVAAATWLRHRQDRGLMHPAVWLAGLLVLQLHLGVGTYLFLKEGGDPHATGAVAFATLHFLCGALTLAACVWITLASFRRVFQAWRVQETGAEAAA